MNSIPVVGWILSFILTTSTAVPFWICWTVCGIGRTYFYWLPPVYQEIPFWNCVGLFTAVGIALRVFTPKFANVVTTTTEPSCKGK
jgi:energy-coupling factor transporter transmembrane protein EcfT